MNMKWRDEFSNDVLDKSKDYIDSIYEVKILDKQINANLRKSAHFHVYLLLDDDCEVSYMTCTCSKKSHCRHQAAVLQYIEDNNLVEKETEYRKLLKSVDENLLKEYLLEIFYDNPCLKEDFISKFKKEPKIYAAYYFDKLERIIDGARGSDYVNFGYYDIDVLARGIEVFLDYEVEDLMKIRQYEIVFELLDKMAGVLNDEMYTNEFSWFDACQRYCDIAYKLEETYVLSDDQLERLQEHLLFMGNYL